MARTGRGGRRARRQLIDRLSLPIINNTRRSNRQSGNAVTAFIGAGQNLLGEMKRHGIAGIQKVQACLGEVLGETAITLAFSTTQLPATPRATVRATGGRRARTVSVASPAMKVSKAQLTCLNAFGIGEQIPASTIAQRTGMQPAACVRALGPLERKGYVGCTGRGQNKLYWKIQAAQQVAA